MARRPTVQLLTKHAALSSDFGREWATKLFGEEAIASLPILQTGKNKGHPKGHVQWRKAMSSGFIPGFGPVAEGQLVDAWIGEGMLSPKESAMVGEWMGRKQNLAGSASMLFQKARDAEAVRQQRDAAERAEENAGYSEEAGRYAKAAGYYETAAAIYDGMGNPDRAAQCRTEAARILALQPAAPPC